METKSMGCRKGITAKIDVQARGKIGLSMFKPWKFDLI
jgi:hypothetical protein